MIKLKGNNFAKVLGGEFKGDKWLKNVDLSLYLAKVEARNQDFYRMIDDIEVVAKVKSFAESVRGKYQYIVVLGIGGSALGAICLDQFNRGTMCGGRPELIVLDNIDPMLIAEVEAKIDLVKSLFLVITKSGGTPETMAQLVYFREKVRGVGLAEADHFVIITDAKNGPLRDYANKNPKIVSFVVPDRVGGRFSVLSAVGLLPAALIGIDIEKLLEGAWAGRAMFLSKNIEVNLSMQLALAQYHLLKKRVNMTVMFPYAQRMIKVADWYRQLLAESIGKVVNDLGQVVHVGITPVSALGVTDQHSQSQLYNEGPTDKLFLFWGVEKMGDKLMIPSDDKLFNWSGVDFEKLMKIEMQATFEALTANKKPAMIWQIEQIDEYNLGEMLMILEGSVAFLGELMGINAYDQPGVELSKQLTIHKLESK